MNVVVYVEKLRRSGRWQLIDPPDAFAYGGGWDLSRGNGASDVLGMHGGDVPGSLHPKEGCPTDLSPELHDELQSVESRPRWWLPLSDLLAIDLNRSVTRKAFVDVEGYRSFTMTGRPACWFGVVAGRCVGHAEMDRLSADPSMTHPSAFTEVEWTVPLVESCPQIAAMVDALSREGDPAGIRLIYGWR